MTMTPKIPRAVAKRLLYYVYLYVNPLDGRVFYVGKGKGSRAVAHLDGRAKKAVAKVIRTIHAAGEQPRIEILAHGLPNEATAFRVEAAVIDALGLRSLANRVRGWRGRRFGRLPLPEAVAQYTKRKANIREPSILIRINELYRPEMTPVGLYDATRSAWKVGKERNKAEYAFAVFEGVIREVYRIEQWVAGGTTFTQQNQGNLRRMPGRWEFVGTLAAESIRKRYVNRYVGHFFKPGSRNPVQYVRLK